MRPSELAYVAEKITCCGLNNIATVFGCTQFEYDSSFEEYDNETLVNEILLNWNKKTLTNSKDEPRHLLVRKLIELKNYLERTSQICQLSEKEFEKVLKDLDIHGKSL